MTCANVADDSGLILGTSGYGLSWNLWMIVEFIRKRKFFFLKKVKTRKHIKNQKKNLKKCKKGMKNEGNKK